METSCRQPTNREVLVEIFHGLVPTCAAHEKCANCSLVPKEDYDLCPVRRLETLIRWGDSIYLAGFSQGFKTCGSCEHFVIDWPQFLKKIARNEKLTLDEQSKCFVCSVRNAKEIDDVVHETNMACRNYEPKHLKDPR